MLNPKYSLKNSVLKTLRENDDSFYYLAPDIIGSINNVGLNDDGNELTVDFSDVYNRNYKLQCPEYTFKNWFENNKQIGNKNLIKDFLMYFISNGKQIDDNEDEAKEEQLDEIIDEFGNIMRDDDKPNNANNTMVGIRNVQNTDKVIQQTVPRSRRFYSDYGRGIITW